MNERNSLWRSLLEYTWNEILFIFTHFDFESISMSSLTSSFYFDSIFIASCSKVQTDLNESLFSFRKLLSLFHSFRLQQSMSTLKLELWLKYAQELTQCLTSPDIAKRRINIPKSLYKVTTHKALQSLAVLLEALNAPNSPFQLHHVSLLPKSVCLANFTSFANKPSQVWRGFTFYFILPPIFDNKVRMAASESWIH